MWKSRSKDPAWQRLFLSQGLVDEMPAQLKQSVQSQLKSEEQSGSCASPAKPQKPTAKKSPKKATGSSEKLSQSDQGTPPQKKRLAHGPATPEKGNKKGKQDIDGDAMTPEKPGVRKSRIKGKRNLENTEKTAEKPGVRKGDKGTQDSNEMPSTSQSAPAKPDGATSQTSACRPVSFGQPSKVETVLKAPGKRKKKNEKEEPSSGEEQKVGQTKKQRRSKANVKADAASDDDLAVGDSDPEERAATYIAGLEITCEETLSNIRCCFHVYPT